MYLGVYKVVSYVGSQALTAKVRAPSCSSLTDTGMMDCSQDFCGRNVFYPVKNEASLFSALRRSVSNNDTLN